MTKSRLEAFTDGVVAIVLTVLVLNIQIPDAPSLTSLLSITNILFAYIVSFIFVAVIWVNHHRMMQMAEKINYRVIWANIFWLFWLTLCPAVTSWVGRNPDHFWPEFSYVAVFTMWSFSYGVLSRQLIQANDPNSHVAIVLKRDQRSKLSMVINLAVLAGVFIFPPIGIFGRFLVSGIWIVSYRKADEYYQKLFRQRNRDRS
ncbi:TMEM175 family protein [Enterococcus sp.]|uniref:TMEM175 family protein n=1 Tax=Enterococcus sp. TaxID=35783 RepID=UPI002912B397|nr:TMEM175 family protein [Enterococcus sp.]MDU5333897.1 TMEM175 family protein [Enterococcus sp.]